MPIPHRVRALPLALFFGLSLPLWAGAEVTAADDAGNLPVRLDTIEVQSPHDDAHAERSLTPGGVTIQDTDVFYERHVGNMADSLRYVPGIWAASGTGGDSLFITSRGSNLDSTDYDSNGIKLFQDGLPVTTADGNNHNRFLDPMAARQIVVAHGANALTYGASNLGGAIDMLSPTARNSEPSQLFFGGGSHGTLNGRVSTGGVSGDADAMVTLEAARRDGYREHSRTKRHSLYANAGWQPTENLDLRFFLTHVDSDEELAGGLSRAQFDADPRQANPSAVSGNFQLNVTSDRAATRGTWDIDEQRRLEFGVSYEDQTLFHPIVDKVMADIDGSGNPVEVFSLLINSNQRTWGGMARYQWRSGDHDVLTGINLADTRLSGGNYRNDGGQRNGQTDVLANRADSVEMFLVDRWHVTPDWTLVYGAQAVNSRRDVRTLTLDSGAERRLKADYSAINPRLGLIRALGGGSEAFASLSRLYEAPTNFELHDDVRGDDNALDAMHGRVLEAGVRGGTHASPERPGWHWDVAVYHAQIRDEILSVDDPDAPGTSLSTNVGRTTHAGLEALLGATIPLNGGTRRIEPLLSVTWNAFSFDDDPVYGSNRLPAAPNHALRGEVMFRNDAGFFAGPTFDVIGARYADFANSYRVGSHRLLGFRAGFDGDGWQLFGELRNLRNTDHVGTFSVRNHATVDDAILQAGEPRSVHVGLRVGF